jgi:cysteine desulfurase
MRRIYLDHNATTPLDPEVLAAMDGVLREHYGNPSSLHWFGQRARAIVEGARGSVARLIGARASEVVFTASGTEADNMALCGLHTGDAARPPRILYAAIEHHAVIRCAKDLAKRGWTAEPVRVDAAGQVDLEHLATRLREPTALVAVMLANNETGVIQPLVEVARLAHASGALVLCDAVQAAGKIAIEIDALGADFVALSAHKLYGPKGIGALWLRRGTNLRPLVRGGGQERHRRAGTENVAGIAGFGRAADLARERLPDEATRMAALRDDLEQRLLAIPGTHRNGTGPRVPNTTNVSFEGIEAESLVLALDLAGVAVASGAACSSGAIEPSHVLRAMGLPSDRVRGALRLSLGYGTTESEISDATAVVEEAVMRQRQRQGAHPRG